ncbi:FecR family protein [Sinomicrobium soli]|uniref:FecR family protein n=1 Tax=Sinomicrobium sp. N-1-3-6 TaxID=2219864 RepID=UPI000DCEB4AC|nr:FecR domain-containing protein [Sinomicrobium sp. N-1-3-6]RAV29208.1 iron dicitrate transport regulator FecR [Sinomicrobium sp. N-1-3-6]
MKYKHYKTVDFCQDEYFQQWVLHPDEDSQQFWEAFLGEHPWQKETVAEAAEMVRGWNRAINEKANAASRYVHQDFEEVFRNIKHGTEAKPVSTRATQKGWEGSTWLKVAAGFTGLAGLALWGVFQFGLWQREGTPTAPQITLQLEDGTLHVIDNDATGTITTKDGKTVGQQDKHILVYNNRVSNATTGPAYNKLSVPYGRQFELVLSDSSHVYLNAGSTLRYPRQFLPGKPREVYLDGEAFFEVTRDTTRTFTVATRDMNTVVYGTRFNVTSYHNEASPYTVLVEGSVGVYRSGAEDIRKITPGQMATLDKDSMTIAAVNVHKYTAWTSGELYFMDDPFALILRKLERHYNVTIKNTYTALDTEQLTSSFHEEDSLELVMRILAKLKPFRYHREGSRITIQALETPQEKHTAP